MRSFPYVWAVLLASGCASLPAAPTLPKEQIQRVARGLRDDAPPDGTLRPGDLLVLTLSRGNQTHDAVGPVDALGHLHVQSGLDVPVAGMSLSEAQDAIARIMHQRDRFLRVDLRISERPTQRVSVLGAFGRPGFFNLAGGMRVTDLAAAAGGLRHAEEQHSAGGDSAIIPLANLAGGALVRDGRALPIDIDLALRGEPGHNVYIHPGDYLYVPFALDQTVSVFGQVSAPGAFVHRKGMRLTEALGDAGGVTVGADKSDIRIVRGPPENPVAYSASLAAIVDQKAHDVALAAGDVVFVTDDPAEDFGEVLNDIIGPVAAIVLSVATTVFVVRSLEQQRLTRQLEAR